MSDDLYKDYVPEVEEYDEELDGSFEHKVREEHLSTKEDLVAKIKKAKAAAKGGFTNVLCAPNTHPAIHSKSERGIRAAFYNVRQHSRLIGSLLHNLQIRYRQTHLQDGEAHQIVGRTLIFVA